MSVGTEAPQTERTRVSSGASVRVNLLPQATREGAKAARQKVIAAGAVGVVILGLAGATYLQRSDLAESRELLAAAELDRTTAQNAVNDLSAFASLEQELTNAHGAVTMALASQASMAGVFQDVAMVMPEDSAILTLNIDFTGEAPDADAGAVPASVGSLRATGETLESFAPGVERMLLQLDKVAGFRDTYLTTAAMDDEGIVTFDLDLQLGSEHLTNRYVDGVPEVLR